MSLWVPPTVSRDLQAQTDAYRMELAEATLSDRVCAEFTAELRRIDPYLELIRASPNATALGLVPGAFHVMRNNPGAPPSLMPILDEHGNPRIPDSGVFEELRRNDMWSERSMKEQRRVAAAAERAKKAREQREHEDRVEEMVERIKAGRDVRVSMSDAAPWTQNVDGRRAVKRVA